MVRLKDTLEEAKKVVEEQISIPYGAIKRGLAKYLEGKEFNFNSLWCD